MPGRPFVLYMGDDKANEGIYKFISGRQFKPGQASNNRLILTEGDLYIARFDPQSRRTFATLGDTNPTSPTSGTGTWVKVNTDELADTAAKLRARFGTTAYNSHFATNRPEDVEVASDGTVYVALTNNTGTDVKDAHGSRKIVEAGDDPAALAFAWDDYAAGGPRGEADPSRNGFSSPDNLVFDSQENLWVVTDISSSRLNKENEYKYHANNAMFMVPTKGPSAGVAFRFANGPIEAELTGPYFTPDEQTLFINVQHPGEESSASGVYEDTSTYTSWWPHGNRTAAQNPSEPVPSLVVVTKLRPDAPDLGTPVVPAPPEPPPPVPPEHDGQRPRLNLLSPGRQRLRTLLGRGIVFAIAVDEPCELDVTLRGRLQKPGRKGRRGGRGGLRRLARTEASAAQAGRLEVRLRPNAALRVLLRRESALPALLHVKATDRAGNVTMRTKPMKFSA